MRGADVYLDHDRLKDYIKAFGYELVEEPEYIPVDDEQNNIEEKRDGEDVSA
jgi:hypothetical protein